VRRLEDPKSPQPVQWQLLDRTSSWKRRCVGKLRLVVPLDTAQAIDL
jgi:hypothetical protein